MKIVDKELKIFGKLYILDFLILVFIIFVLFSMFFVIPKKPTIPNEPLTNSPYINSDTWLEVYVRTKPFIPEIAEVMRKGDVDVAPNGTVSYKIDKIISIEDAYYDSSLGIMRKRATLKLLVRVFEDNGKYFTKNFHIIMGKTFDFKTNIYKLDFEIIRIGKITKNVEQK